MRVPTEANAPDMSVVAADRTTPWWLWLSVPIATLAVVASLSGIFVDSVYARETENFAAQGVGQEIANLIAYPVLLLLAWGRAEDRCAHLGWAGVLVYSVYSYAIYAFDVRFNGLFLVYVEPCWGCPSTHS